MALLGINAFPLLVSTEDILIIVIFFVLGCGKIEHFTPTYSMDLVKPSLYLPQSRFLWARQLWKWLPLRPKGTHALDLFPQL
jgi:hypothetical protein